MQIVIAGGSGFVGEPLARLLLARGDDVIVLSRDPARVRAGRGMHWDGRTQGAWSETVASADVVINLAGENIGAGRWSEERKQRLIASRLDATNAIVDALRLGPSRKRALIQSSAIGFYGLRHDETLDESAPKGQGFLADLVDRWELAARKANDVARLVIVRLGVVLAVDGGALAKMLTPFKLGVGGPVGSGGQWMSWIDRGDALRFITWAIDHADARGVYNVTAPAPVRNRDFSRILGRALHRPAFMPAPAFALRLAFGEMADEILLGGQRVIPARAQSEGFSFQAPSLEDALSAML